MTTSTMSSFVVDGERVTELLQRIRENLPSTGGEVLLDFFLVQAVDTNALQSLEELAGAAEVMKAKIILRGVNVEIYKVLTLAGLTSRFSFLN